MFHAVCIYADLRIGFLESVYAVSESAGVLEIAVGELTDESGYVATPLGVRIATKDGSAVGKNHWHKERDIYPLYNPAGEDYQGVLTTIYFRPGQPPLTIVRITIYDDSVEEGEERFTVELKTYDISTIVVNAETEVVIIDNDETDETSK